MSFRLFYLFGKTFAHCQASYLSFQIKLLYIVKKKLMNKWEQMKEGTIPVLEVSFVLFLNDFIGVLPY